jgi:Cu/Ag efflux protein CusF
MKHEAHVDRRHARGIAFGSIAALSTALAAAPFAIAQQADHQSHHGTQAAASPATAMSDGEVRKVDRKTATITLKHGELKALGMPPMTMAFEVKDKSLLDKVKAGDKVRFAAQNIGGQLTVTAIEPLR